MAKKSTQSAYQYAPLIAPSNWKGEERQFSIHLSQLLDDLYRKCGALAKNSYALSAYPVGSIYLSLEDKSPASLFGGTWEQIKDTFLLAAGDTYEAGGTGGESEHTITTSEMPSHTHTFKYSEDGGNTYSTFSFGRDGTTASGKGYGGTQEGIKAFSTFRIRVNETGDGEAHNNMPPYLAVYIWKRTA